VLRQLSNWRKTKTGQSGQALVEFSLVFLVFITIFVGVVEFGLAFNAKLTASFASRDAAIAASESGGAPATADCAVLNAVDKDLTPPLSKTKINNVDIFWSDKNGNQVGGAVQRYRPFGPLCSTNGLGGWTNTSNGYPASDRCSFIGGTKYGCLAGHPEPDWVGVRLVYRHDWVTPLPGLVGLAGTGFTFTQTNLVVMEPIPVGQ
jgi:uncharacterized protein (UPF0333 family)